MGFDFQNFGIGLVAGWVSAYAVYRARHRLGDAVQSGRSGAGRARAFATRNADSRYVNEMINLAEQHHIAGEFVRLSEILIEPRFLPAIPLIDLEDDDEVARDVFDVVPRIHDFPYLHAPYNLDTMAIDDLAQGSNMLALLGVPGSGRTTAMLTIIMHSLGHVKFKPPVDKVQQKLDAEESRLSEKERATRIKERIMMAERAKERLADERGASFDSEDDATHELPLFQRLMPVYVHMGDITISANEFGKEIDPAEPLVRAVQYRVGGIASKTVPRNVYKRLNRGQVLLLIDGYDDLPPDQQPKMIGWLRALIEQYGDNFFIVTGPATGYGHLTGLGLTPTFLRPWSELDCNNAAEYWANNWARLAAKGRGRRQRGAKRPDQEKVDRAKIGNRAMPAFEVALKLWANYAEDTETSGADGWLRAYLARHLSNQDIDTLLPQIAQIATIQIDEGFITSKRLEALAIGGDAVIVADDDEEAEEAGKKKRGKKADSESTTSQGRLLEMLRKSGLLLRFRGDRYQFRHPHLAAYLASLTLKDASVIKLAEKAMQPNWGQTLGYAAMHTKIDAAVKARFEAPPDMLHSQTFEVARWLAHAPPDVGWRATILKHLGNMLTAPSQYPYIRDRAAAALVGTRERNILHVFRRTVRTEDPRIRLLSCFGIGATGEAEGMSDLIALLRDQDESVQLAAGMGLSVVNSEKALEAMVLEFTQGTEKVQQALAIAFAAMPEDGYPILFDAIEDPEMLVRRAAVFGMRRLRTTWALIAIYRAFLEDEQWYVRSAAQQTFQEIQHGRETSLTTAFPRADSLEWLSAWASTRGENLPAGDAANQMLLRALQEGNPEIRAAAAACLGQLGLAETIRPLYAALNDKQEDVRIAAQRSLAEFQAQIGAPLPTPA
jgi:HEAT repeat protein